MNWFPVIFGPLPALMTLVSISSESIPVGKRISGTFESATSLTEMEAALVPSFAVPHSASRPLYMSAAVRGAHAERVVAIATANTAARSLRKVVLLSLKFYQFSLLRPLEPRLLLERCGDFCGVSFRQPGARRGVLGSKR